MLLGCRNSVLKFPVQTFAVAGKFHVSAADLFLYFCPRRGRRLPNRPRRRSRPANSWSATHGCTMKIFRFGGHWIFRRPTVSAHGYSEPVLGLRQCYQNFPLKFVRLGLANDTVRINPRNG